MSVLCLISDITVFGVKYGAYEIPIFRLVELGKVNFQHFLACQYEIFNAGVSGIGLSTRIVHDCDQPAKVFGIFRFFAQKLGR